MSYYDELSEFANRRAGEVVCITASGDRWAADDPRFLLRFERFAFDDIPWNTSGTTGPIKTVMHTTDSFRAWIARWDAPQSGFGLSRSFFVPRSMLARDLYAFTRGAMLYQAGSEPNAARWLDMCEADKVEGVFLFPKQMLNEVNAMLAAGHRYRFPRLYIAGTPVTTDQVAEYRDKLGGDAGIFINYGCGEIGAVACGPYDPARPSAVGRPAADLKVSIVNGRIVVGDVILDDLGHIDPDGVLIVDGRWHGS